MEQKNKYGFLSGGFIFDKLDRWALDYINTQYPYTQEENWFTARAEIQFRKQLCSDKDIYYKADVDFYDSLTGSIIVNIDLLQTDTIIATARIGFRRAKKDFCQIKRNGI